MRISYGAKNHKGKIVELWNSQIFHVRIESTGCSEVEI